jgi:hypothetical protein
MNTVIETLPANLGIEENLLPWGLPNTTNRVGAAAPASDEVHWSWACRRLDCLAAPVPLDNSKAAKPVPGDLALVRVEKAGFHKQLTTADNRRMRLYPGAQFVGVFGNRYASDAYEAEVEGVKDLSLLTGAGMIGTVKSKHGTMAEPTRISLVGFVRGRSAKRLNLKELFFKPTQSRRRPANLIYIVGSSMNSGKTTTAARLIRGLSDLGLKVVACKLTGSVSNHDPDELAAAAARKVIDFSDYGFASTYLCSKKNLIDLFHTMLADVADVAPDVVLMELADGLLQRETALLLTDPEIKQAGRGVVLSAAGSISALWGVQHLRRLDHRVIAVSGKFTSSPLAMREYSQHDSDVPVFSSAGNCSELAQRVGSFLSKE